MKKLLIVILLFCLFAVTGCGKKTGESKKEGNIFNPIKTMTCAKEEVDEYGYKTGEVVTITYNSKKILKTETEMIFQVEPALADFELKFTNAYTEEIIKLDGVDMKNEKISDSEILVTRTIDYENINPEDVREKFKELLGESYDISGSSIYLNFNTSIDEFKKEYFSDYVCN